MNNDLFTCSHCFKFSMKKDYHLGLFICLECNYKQSITDLFCLICLKDYTYKNRTVYDKKGSALEKRVIKDYSKFICPVCIILKKSVPKSGSIEECLFCPKRYRDNDPNTRLGGCDFCNWCYEEETKTGRHKIIPSGKNSQAK